MRQLKKRTQNDTITGTVKEIAKDIAGKSNAVRQKALEDLLNSIK